MESLLEWKPRYTYMETGFHGGSQKPSSENGFENWVWTFECSPDLVIDLRLYLWFIIVNYPIISLLTCKLDCFQINWSILHWGSSLHINHISCLFDPITQCKIKLIYKHTFQINRKGIRDYNFVQLIYQLKPLKN